jgi:hypothetical protein
VTPERKERSKAGGSKVTSVVVDVECGNCHGKRVFPGGKYMAEGEVINCPVCNGRGTERGTVSLSLLRDLLNGVSRPIPGPFNAEDPATCAHEWEPHIWELGKQYCPYCATTRDPPAPAPDPGGKEGA